MSTLTPVPTKGEARKMVPQTAAKYGVVFGRSGTYEQAEVRALYKRMSKTLVVAILQVLQFEDTFRHLDVSGHLIDLETGQEVYFNRHAPYNLHTINHEPSLN